MEVISTKETQGNKLYIIEEDGRTYTAEPIFTERKPHSRIIIEVINKIKEIITERTDRINHQAYVKYIDIKKINQEYCLLSEGEKEFQPLFSCMNDQKPGLEKVLKWMRTLGEVFKEAEDNDVELSSPGLHTLAVDREGNLLVFDPDIIGRIEQYQKTTANYPAKEVYYPPEYYKKELLDRKSSLYSAGVVFYYLLTGKWPYSSSDKADLIDEILNTKPVEPRYLNLKISNELNTFILMLLQKDRKNRLKDWTEFLETFQRMKDNKQLKALQDQTDKRRKMADKMLRTARRKRGFRVFWRKYWKPIAIIAVVIVLFLSMGLLDGTDSIVTEETSPEEVVSLFYKGIEDKMIQNLDESCLVDLKNLENMVMQTYVIERMRMAYNVTDSDESSSVFGLEELIIDREDNKERPVFSASYYFYIYQPEEMEENMELSEMEELKKDEFFMEDIIKLERIDNKWQITEIEGDIKYLIEGNVEELIVRKEDE